ncbi:MAG: ABC transporter permease subunit [Defluviitaleaceae bacterium]|nr:ABC transporter permease subunit [Defluviitaleaceae bacterium]
MQVFTSFLKKLGVAAFWFLVWEGAARLIANQFVIVGPVDAFGRLFELALTLDFWTSINFSILRILLGFGLSMAIGVLLAIICHMSGIARALITPAINVIKAVPVVSIALLLTFSLSPSMLSIAFALLTVLPIFFFNTLKGIENTDKNLLEMAEVFRVGMLRKIRHIYVPSVTPFVVSAAESGLGFAWKASIAGEVISMATREGIGGSMHAARQWLLTPDLWAWTITIVLLSFAMEKLFFLGFRRFRDGNSN